MKTKIIATIGPASASPEMIKKLITQGVDVFRLNFSHGKIDDHAEVIRIIDQMNLEMGTHVATLADLGGPKIRLSEVQGGFFEIKAGEQLQISTALTQPGNRNLMGINYPGFARDVEPGQNILVDDGRLQFSVLQTNHEDLITAVALNSGTVRSRKGVNLPDTRINLPSLTDKDREDLTFILHQKIQWIALSFVRSANDIFELKSLIRDYSPAFLPGIVAKIEKPEAIDNLVDIIKASDAIMVARGDLGIEIPIENVPVLQKKIVNQCILAGKPVIVATQMMEGMIENIFPTRAEVNDVANAVFDGADAVMLSGETSVGKYPVETVTTMSRILRNIEDYENIYFRFRPLLQEQSADFVTDSVVFSAVDLATETRAAAIIGLANSGYSVTRISSYRPKSPVHVFSLKPEVLKKLSLVWGIKCHIIDDHLNSDQVGILKERLMAEEILKKGDLVVEVTHYPVHAPDKANRIALSRV